MLKFYRKEFVSGVMLIHDRKPKLDEKGKMIKGIYEPMVRPLRPTDMSRPETKIKVPEIEEKDGKKRYKKDEDGRVVMREKIIPAAKIKELKFHDEEHVMEGYPGFFKKM